MIRIIKYLRGYLQISVSGFSPERFLNLCSKNEIVLWDIRKEDDSYIMYIGVADYKKVRPFVKKTGTKAVILKRYGLPFFIYNMKNKKVFLVGLCLAFGCLMWSADFIWTIELIGNYQITEENFLDYLDQIQVKEGMRKQNLNIEYLEKSLRREFPGITWTCAKLTGTKLTIYIKENDAPMNPDVSAVNSGKDLVSEYDGILVEMIVRKGIPLVKIGQTIQKGDKLVSGSVPILDENQMVKEYQYVDADADIFLKHQIRYQEELPAMYVKKVYTGREKSHIFIRLGEKYILNKYYESYQLGDSMRRESQVVLFDKIKLPVYVINQKEREYQNVECLYTREQAEDILNQKFKKFIETLKEKGVQIIEKDVKIDLYNQKFIMSGELLVKEAAGVSVDTEKISVGEINQNE